MFEDKGLNFIRGIIDLIDQWTQWCLGQEGVQSLHGARDLKNPISEIHQSSNSLPSYIGVFIAITSILEREVRMKLSGNSDK